MCVYLWDIRVTYLNVNLVYIFNFSLIPTYSILNLRYDTNLYIKYYF